MQRTHAQFLCSSEAPHPEPSSLCRRPKTRIIYEVRGAYLIVSISRPPLYQRTKTHFAFNHIMLTLPLVKRIVQRMSNACRA